MEFQNQCKDVVARLYDGKIVDRVETCNVQWSRLASGRVGDNLNGSPTVGGKEAGLRWVVNLELQW